jgi:hypothetical protein
MIIFLHKRVKEGEGERSYRISICLMTAFTRGLSMILFGARFCDAGD